MAPNHTSTTEGTIIYQDTVGFAVKQMGGKTVISFPSLEYEERGFEVLTGTGKAFEYVGNKRLAISKAQLGSLKIQGVPVRLH